MTLDFCKFKRTEETDAEYQKRLKDVEKVEKKKLQAKMKKEARELDMLKRLKAKYEKTDSA